MFKKLLSLLSPKVRANLAIATISFLFYGLSSIAMLVVVFSLLFKIKGGTTVSSLYQDFGIIIALVIFKGLCNMLADFKKHEAGFDIVQQIREGMILKLKEFSLGFYTNERLGEINTILHKDVDNMSMVVAHTWSRMFGDFLIALSVFIGILFINIKLAIVMALTVPIPLGFLYYTIKESYEVENKNNSALMDMVSLFVEYVRGIPVLKSG